MVPSCQRPEKQDANGGAYYEVQIDGFNLIIQPVDCRQDAPDQCPVARLNAIINLPDPNGPQAAQRQKYLAKVEEFNRTNAFLKVYESGNRLVALRYTNAAFGVKVGTIRTELQLFSKSFREFIAEYLQKA